MIDAVDVEPGMRLAGTLPPVPGLRDTYAAPVVKRTRRRNGMVAVTWTDGTKGYYHPAARVEVVSR